MPCRTAFQEPGVGSRVEGRYTRTSFCRARAGFLIGPRCSTRPGLATAYGVSHVTCPWSHSCTAEDAGEAAHRLVLLQASTRTTQPHIETCYWTSQACLSICLENTFKSRPPLRIMSKVATTGPGSDRKRLERHATEVQELPRCGMRAGGLHTVLVT